MNARPAHLTLALLTEADRRQLRLRRHLRALRRRLDALTAALAGAHAAGEPTAGLIAQVRNLARAIRALESYARAERRRRAGAP